MRVTSCRFMVAAGTAALLVAGGVQAPIAVAEQVRDARLATGPLQLPIVLTAVINEAPTTLGIADSNLYNLAPADIDKTLDELQALGVKDIRIAVPWVYVQPTSPAGYDWTKLDYVVNAAHSRDMGILGVVTATPVWAGQALNGHPDETAYASFAGAVAARYAGKIGSYEIWNEPNGKIFWSPVSASAYTELLKAAYPAIKAADPNARVIGGVLGSVSTIPGLSQSPITFVRDMYSAGAHGYFDALSLHPYHHVTPFSQGDVAEAPINQAASIRQMMIANGDGNLKLWATEYGLPTSSVSQTQQAGFIHDFVASWQNVDGAGPIFLYTTRDSDTGAFDDEANFGLFQTDWTKKEAADTVATLIADLADGSAEPFDVTPYLPSNGFLQSVMILVKQVINQLLVVPKFIGQIVGGVINAVVQFVKTGLGILTGAKPAPVQPAPVQPAAVQPAEAAPAKLPTETLGSAAASSRTSANASTIKSSTKQPETKQPEIKQPEIKQPETKQPSAKHTSKSRSGTGSSARQVNRPTD